MVMTTQDDAADWGNIAVIAAPGGRDMAFADKDVVGGIKVYPAVGRREDTEPGMAGIGPQHAWHAWGRTRQQVARHVTRRQAQAAHGGDADMGQILTDAGADLEHPVYRRGGVGDTGIIA